MRASLAQRQAPDGRARLAYIGVTPAARPVRIKFSETDKQATIPKLQGP